MQGMMKMKMMVWFCMLLSVVLAIDVDNTNFTTALANAVPYDSFVLLPGIYEVGLNIQIGVPISMTAVGSGSATISCRGPGNTGFTFSRTVNISNIDFTNCQAAITLDMGSEVAQISNCNFYANEKAIQAQATLQVSDCLFYNNTMAFYSTGTSTFTRINVTANGITAGGAGAPIITVGGPLTFSDSVIKNNYAMSSASGKLIQLEAAATEIQAFTNTIFTDNFAIITMIQTNLGTIHFADCSFSNIGTNGPFISTYKNNIYLVSSDFANLNTGLYVSYSNITVIGSTFSNSSILLDGSGAVITLSEFANSSTSVLSLFSASATITYSNFYNIHSQSGHGGVCDNILSSLDISHSTFIGNTGADLNGQGGGVVYSVNGDLVLFNVTMSRNAFLASQYGGTLHVSGGKLTLTNVTMDHNGDGAIYATDGCSVIIDDSTFFANSAVRGGAAYFGSCKVAISNTNFLLNDALSGGAIVADSVTNMTIAHSTFDSNTASLGGAIFINTSVQSIYFNNVVMYNNTARSGGGIFQFAGSSITIEHSNITTNTATRSGLDVGGGGALILGTAYFINTTFELNVANYGGGISAVANTSAVTILQTTFNQNRAYCGGGLHANTMAVFNIRNSTFSGNYATSNGGAFHLYNSNITVINTSIYGSTAQNGAGIYNNKAYLQVVNSSIVSNTAYIAGGGIYISSIAAFNYIGDSTITANTATTSGTGVFVDSFYSSIFMRHILIETRGAVLYCCGGSRKNTTSYELCNFPSCTSSCLETTNSCDCPFSYSGSEIPVISTVNVNCTCKTGWYGTWSYCQSDINECDQPNNCTEHSTCENTPGNYSCNCNPGFQGDGKTECTGSDPCVPNMCPPGQVCVSSGSNNNVTVACVPASCPSGFIMQGTTCVDVNECLSNNGGCDNYVICNNTRGGFVCPPCPTGMTGNSSILGDCKTLCGDEICDSLIGETCVTCPNDCRNTSCASCGDGVCDSGETCTSCFEDCKIALSCLPKCGTCVNGVCDNKGICQCTDSWSGPACDVPNTGIVVITNTSSPTVTVSPSSDRFVQFSIGILRVQELDKDQVVSSVELVQEQNYTLVNATTDGDKTSTWTYSTVLSNKAVVNFTFYQFEQQATIVFADQNFTFQPHTLKFTANISSWPFKGLGHTLGVVMDTKGSGGSNNGCGEANNGVAGSGDFGNLQWVKITQNGVILYGQFADLAIVDGRKRQIQFSLNTTSNLISAILPHFWYNAAFDPSFSVLVDGATGSCHSRSSSGPTKTIAIAVSVGVVGAILLVALAFYGKMWYRKSFWRHKMAKTKSVEAPLHPI